MKIETKYNVGDFGVFTVDGKLFIGEVFSIIVSAFDNYYPTINYTFKVDNKSRSPEYPYTYFKSTEKMIESWEPITTRE